VQLAAQQGEQARLARAVRADEADALARIERHVGAFEQELGARMRLTCEKRIMAILPNC